MANRSIDYPEAIKTAIETVEYFGFPVIKIENKFYKFNKEYIVKNKKRDDTEYVVECKELTKKEMEEFDFNNLEEL